jgi:hypothetical protein
VFKAWSGVIGLICVNSRIFETPTALRRNLLLGIRDLSGLNEGAKAWELS